MLRLAAGVFSAEKVRQADNIPARDVIRIGLFFAGNIVFDLGGFFQIFDMLLQSLRD